MLKFLRRKKYTVVDFYIIFVVAFLLGASFYWQAFFAILFGAYASAVIDKTTT